MAIILYVGETHVTFNAHWTDDSNADVDLTNPDTTNATLSLRWGSNTRGIASRSGDGTFSAGPRNTGHFKYTVSAADVATANAWKMQFKATYADGTVLFADPIDEETREAQ